VSVRPAPPPIGSFKEGVKKCGSASRGPIIQGRQPEHSRAFATCLSCNPFGLIAFAKARGVEEQSLRPIGAKLNARNESN
jgi:hypothetical protein